MLENVAIWLVVFEGAFYAAAGVGFASLLLWATLRLVERPRKPPTKVLVDTSTEWVGDINGRRVTAFLYAGGVWIWRTRESTGSAATKAGALASARDALCKDSK